MSSLCCHLPVCRVMYTRVQDCSACVKTVLGDSIPLNNVFIPYLFGTVIRVDLLEMPQSLHNCWGALHICVINHDVACLCMNVRDKRKRQTRHKVTVKNKHFTTCSASSFSMENKAVFDFLPFATGKVIATFSVHNGNKGFHSPNVMFIFIASLFHIYIFTV